jgi:hypothetical protein
LGIPPANKPPSPAPRTVLEPLDGPSGFAADSLPTIGALRSLVTAFLSFAPC